MVACWVLLTTFGSVSKTGNCLGNFSIWIYLPCHDANTLGVPTMGTTNQGHVKIRCGPELSYRDETTTQAAIRKSILFFGEAAAMEFVNSIFTRGFSFFFSFLFPLSDTGQWTLYFVLQGLLTGTFFGLAPPFFSPQLLLAIGALNSGAKYGWVVYNIIFRDFTGFFRVRLMTT